MKTRIAILALLLLAACTVSDDRATELLQQNGYTNIQLTGYEMLSCSESDSFNTGFMATGPTGIPVKGVICCGLMKSCTIRFE